MNIFDGIKNILGLKPIKIGDLNSLAVGEAEPIRIRQKTENPLDGIIITDEYKRVLALLQADYPIIFVTGNAGTGKSTLIRYLREKLSKKLVILAPTGVAALNVEGATIHSFFHFPPKIHEEKDIKLVFDRELYQKLELLILDEASMVRCDLLDSIDKFLRKNRSNNTPFGGVQLLLIGDLFQLPPVASKKEETILDEMGYKSPYFFSSFSLQQSSLLSVELKYIYRQEDCHFIDLLNQIRIGENVECVTSEINKQCYGQSNHPIDVTLTCTNINADQINFSELQKLKGKEVSFKGKITGQFSIGEDKLPSPIDLKLKIDAHVMFTKNDAQKRWINGTFGIVRKISQNSISVEVSTISGKIIHDVRPVTWETYKYSYNTKDDKIISEKIGAYTQYPLMLAWAVTIHKSQGKTLENVLIDMGYGTFASGQAYVALSRCRSIRDIRLSRPIQNTDIICDPRIKRFYSALEKMNCSENVTNSYTIVMCPNGHNNRLPVDYLQRGQPICGRCHSPLPIRPYLRPDSKNPWKCTPKEIFQTEYVSFTRINTFKKCPRKFELIYLCGFEDKSSRAAQVGGLVHKILDIGARQKKALETKELLKLYDNAISSINLTFNIPRTELTKYLDNFVNINKKRISQIWITEQECKSNIADYVLKCIIDRIDRSGESVTLIDYKTGRPKYVSNKQLEVYAFSTLAGKSWSPVQLEFQFLKTGEVRNWSYTRELHSRIEKWLFDSIREIENTESFLRYQSELCEYCSVSRYCQNI
jgi:ATP-dependent DNA helicase PIF1